LPQSDAMLASPGPGEQSYIERPPHPAVAGLISAVWIQQVAPDAPPYTHRNVPNGSVEVLCEVGDLPRVVGPLTAPLVEVLAPGTTVVGMRFHPGAAPSALGLPASDLVDLTLAAEEPWGSAAVALGERVDAATSPEEALAALQRETAGRLGDTPAPDPVVNEAVRQLRWRTDDVGALSASLHISERQLRRRCEAAVGLAPKTLHRLLRFQGFLALAQHAIAHGRTPTEDGLALLAAEAGYADQSHLNRECLRLTGLTPRAFLGETEAHCGCGHDHAASFMPVLGARPAPAAA
jgi:AraC-like DNA-binding protein